MPADLPKFAPVLSGVPARPALFLGREEFGGVMVSLLRRPANRAVAVHGPPGAGKTALAASLARHARLRQRFPDGVLWASLGEGGEAARALDSWGLALGKDLCGLPGPVERAHAVGRLIADRRMLIVIDGVENAEEARLLVCGGPGCTHLITARDAETAHDSAGEGPMKALPPLGEAAAFELLGVLAPLASRENPERLKALIRLCSGLPLALELLGCYLADLHPAGLSQTFRLERAASCLQLRPPGESPLRALLALVLEALPQAMRQAYDCLQTFAPEPESFSEAAALEISGATPEELAALASQGLLRRQGERLAVPRALAEAGRALAPAEAIDRHRRHYLALVKESRQVACLIEPEYGQVCRAWSGAPQGEQLLEWLEAFSPYQQQRGLWNDYASWAERCLKAAESLGLKHEAGVLSNNLGKVYGELGLRERSLACYQRALPILEETGSPAELAALLANLGSAYAHVGRSDRALACFQRGLELLQPLGESPTLATTLNNMGKVHNDLGEREQAVDFFQRALQAAASLGSPLLEITVRYNLALTFRSQGKIAEAIAELRRVVELERLIEHPDLAGDSAFLAQLEGELRLPRIFRWLKTLLEK